MLQNNDVRTVLGSVARELSAAGDSEPPAALTFVDLSAIDSLKVNVLRARARLRIELDSGSGRPVIGPAIRFGKRAFRRGVRWYVKPVSDQQTDFNLGVVDVADAQSAAQTRIETRLAELEERLARLEGQDRE